jgi:hypothetical protein
MPVPMVDTRHVLMPMLEGIAHVGMGMRNRKVIRFRKPAPHPLSDYLYADCLIVSPRNSRRPPGIPSPPKSTFS